MKKIISSIVAFVLVSTGFLACTSLVLAQTDDLTYSYTNTSSDLTDEQASALAGTTLIVVIVSICCGLLIAAGLAYLVYSDAKKNNVPNGVLWAVLTFFFGIIPLLIYFLAIKKKKE